jgi:hypothetical protein
MFLDDKELYMKEQKRLFRMSLSKLETLVGELHQRRVMEHDIEVEAQYRLAGWVLIQRTKKDNSLIYHLN